MKFLRAAVSEVIGLFVDDWLFTLLLVGWVGLFAAVGARLPRRDAATAAAPLFFIGIALLVLIFVVRKAHALCKAKRQER